MGLLARIRQWGRRSRHASQSKTQALLASRRWRICRFEEVEPRQLLSATVNPIQVGSVYYEDHNEQDTTPDVIRITFDGGAQGTRLTKLTIDTDKLGDGLTIGDTFFDAAAGGPGVYGYAPLTIVSQVGIDSVNYTLSADGTKLAFTFEGFDAGETLVFSIDVDEMGFLGANAVAEGNEFEGSMLYATFTAPHYYTASGSDMFLDYYDDKLQETTLNLPPDSYVPPAALAQPIYTAGAIFPLQQEPLPASISGTVFEDLDADNVQDPGDKGISGVTLSLLVLENGTYVSTGQTTTTDANGDYAFDGLEPGTYRVVETQPSGYMSVGAKAGTIDGVTHGSVQTVDIITGVDLEGGDDSVNNDFAEVMPASISGQVAVDRDGDDVYDAGEPTLAGVTLRLLDEDGNLVATTVTDANGQYSFTGLYPGVYRVEEVQPIGYFDGPDSVGSEGGVLDPDDAIDLIPLAPGVQGVHYDFLEWEPVSLSGYVYVDNNNDGVFDSSESPIAGVTVTLRNSSGKAIATTTTNSSGYYEFTGLAPNAVYSVVETQPSGYWDGLDTPGNLGGNADENDILAEVSIPVGKNATQYNFGELAPASISGKVYADENQNNDYDTGEKLLAGVTVHLLDSSGNRIKSTVTDKNGYYEFTGLEPGVYGVEEIQPAPYFDGADQVGTAGGKLSGTDKILGAKLTSGLAATGYDFGEIEPASISGYVFQDGDTIVTYVGETVDVYSLRDGQLTADDKRLAGVTLQLADKNGNAMLDGDGKPITTVTDQNGYYSFTGLKPGTYTVIEVQPDGYITSINTAGSNGGLPMDPVHQLDAMILAQLSIPADSDAILRITVGPGDTAILNNFSEILVTEVERPDPPDPPDGPGDPPARFDPLGTPSTPIGLPDTRVAPLVYTPAATDDVLVALYGGGGIDPIAYTWHLSVVNAGLPRRDQVGPNDVAQLYTSFYFNPVSWTGAEVNESLWLLADADGRPLRQLRFGLANGFPVTGDWNGDGTIKVGVFLNGLWFLDLNGNGLWDAGDLWAQMGQIGDQAVAGDWDGDGKTDIGILGPVWAGDGRALAAEPGLPDVRNLLVGRYKNVPPDPDQAPVAMRTMKRSSQGKIRADLIDHVFRFGREGDIAIAGDWNGDGITNIGLFRGGVWFLDADGNGTWSEGDVYIENFGQGGDMPVIGDWTGDGVAKIGVYRKGTWYLDTNNNHVLDSQDKVIQLGGPGDIPVVGDWTGDGVDKVGVYRRHAPKTEQQASDGTLDQRTVDAMPAAPGANAGGANSGGAAAVTAAKPAAAAPVRK